MNDFDVTHEERRLNVECGLAIEKAISETYVPGAMAGTGYYDNKTAVKTVIDAYGADRAAAVLAANINCHNSDGRLTRANKEWAKSIEVPDKPDYYLNTHLTIIDGFADKLREAIQQAVERESQNAGIDNSIKITSDTRDDNGWVKGLTSGGVSFMAKVFDKPSRYGIDGGRVSKLEVREGDKYIANYDRGWDIQPKTSAYAAIYKRIMSVLNNLSIEPVLNNAERAFIPPQKSETIQNVENYLIGKMGFNKAVVKACIEQGLVYQTEVYSEKLDKNLPCAVFAGFDEAGEMQSAIIKGFGTYEKVAPGSTLKYAFVLPAKESKDKPAAAVSVFENPLELLAGASLANMNGKAGYDVIHRMSVVKTWLYSTHVKALKNFLESNPNVRTVNLCLTNSPDGRVLADRINTMLKSLGEQRGEAFKVNNLIPADANSYMDKLQNKNNEIKEKRKAKENRD